MTLQASMGRIKSSMHRKICKSLPTDGPTPVLILLVCVCVHVDFYFCTVMYQLGERHSPLLLFLGSLHAELGIKITCLSSNTLF